MDHPIASILGGTRCELAPAVSWNEYKDLPALNPSTIVHGLEDAGSMLHLLHSWTFGRPDTDAMLWGRALHCLLFEPRLFEDRYRVWAGRRAGKAYEDFAAQAWEDHAEVLKEDQYDSVILASQGFLREPKVQALIAAGQAEQTVFAVEGAIQCRGRIDWISTSAHRLVDLKTTKSVVPQKFGRDFYGFDYDVKLGLYQRWLDRVTGDHWPVEVIAMENKPPHDIVVMPIPDAVLERGARKGMAVIARVEKCIRSGNWPGVTAGEYGVLYTPTWEMDEELVEFDE